MVVWRWFEGAKMSARAVNELNLSALEQTSRDRNPC